MPARSSFIRVGPELDQIAAAARRLTVFVSRGFNELSPVSVGCLSNSNVLIDDDGAILNHRRKLVSTLFEKLTWANGDSAGPYRRESAARDLISGQPVQAISRAHDRPR